VRDYASSLIRALAFLHDDLGVIHGDVKPGNAVLIKKDEMNISLKLIDFDSWTYIGNPVSDVISYEYTAPEKIKWSLDGKRPPLAATEAMDVWSVGMTILRMLTPPHVRSLIEGDGGLVAFGRQWILAPTLS
jgi:serine/threonine protein kinase